MNYLDRSFGLLEMGLGVAALIFFFRAFGRKNQDRTKKNASPPMIAGQSMLGIAFIARLTNLLFKQRQATNEIIEILTLFIAAAAIFIMLAILYRRVYNRS
jgi:NADH:ubiquinone oxidoreductase subunit K